MLVRQATLSAFAAEYISCVQVILSYSADECTLSDRYMYFATTNNNGLHDALEGSMFLRYEKLTADFASFDTTVSHQTSSAIGRRAR